MKTRQLLVIGAIVTAGLVGLVVYLASRGSLPAELGSQRLELGLGTAETKAEVMMGGNYDYLTPLGQGYLAINNQTRGLDYVSEQGIQDVSARFGLTTEPERGLDPPVYNTALKLEAGPADSVLATTTVGAFIVRGIDNITTLPSSDKAYLYFTDSAYDETSNSLFVLAAYSKTLYRYQLDQPEQGPQEFHSVDRTINRVAAGGGKVAVYYDAVPTAQAAVVSEFAKTNQVEPVVLNIADKAVSRPLAEGTVYTYIDFSGDGQAIASKAKFKKTLTISRLNGSERRQLPAADSTGGLAWDDQRFYLATNKAVWQYQLGQAASSLTKYAELDATVSRLSVNDGRLVASAANNLSYDSSARLGGAASSVNALAGKRLASGDYSTEFAAYDGRLFVTLRSGSEAGIGQARDALGGSLSSPNVTVNQIIGGGTYRYALPALDD